MLDRYAAQVRLLLGALKEIANETAFALKGGTAINLFYRDMPRLSVDIDLTYLPVADRQSSLEEMDNALDRIVAAIAAHNPRVEARRVAGGGNFDTRIMVSDGRTQIKGAKLPYIRRPPNWPISGGAPFPGCHGWLPGSGCPPKPALRAVRSAGNGYPARLGRGLLGQHNL